MKRCFSSLLFVSLFLFASSSWAQTSGSAKELFDGCLENYKRNDFDKALADCSRAIELDPRSTLAYAMRGLMLLQKGNFEGAIADTGKALELDPRNPVLYRQRGMAKFQKGDFDGAIADYDKAVEIEPSYESYRQRALPHFAKGNYDKVIDDLSMAIEKSPEPVRELYNVRAQAKFRKKDWGGAIIDYNTGIKIDPKFPDAYFFRGLTLLNQGKDVEAQKDFDKFLELAPDKKAFLEKWIEKTKRERTIRE